MTVWVLFAVDTSSAPEPVILKVFEQEPFYEELRGVLTEFVGKSSAHDYVVELLKQGSADAWDNIFYLEERVVE